ncbi:MAG: type II toxin-antitoxin system RelE/ParE family toxin [Saprospiraceae bacterium]|nr:type II toxin-antitoxin system RelE/ParE family toxin [Candidatus Brachybacter algidus]
MKIGYRIYWTNNALAELAATITYLKENFSDKELRKLAFKIESTIQLISINPNVFPKSEIKDIYRVVIFKYNTMYYRNFFRIDKTQLVRKFDERYSPDK